MPGAACRTLQQCLPLATAALHWQGDEGQRLCHMCRHYSVLLLPSAQHLSFPGAWHQLPHHQALAACADEHGSPKSRHGCHAEGNLRSGTGP